MIKRILLIGSTGMLGIEVLRELSQLKNYKIYATIRNLKDKKLISKYFKTTLKGIHFYNFEIKGDYTLKLKKIVKNKDYVVNCVGVIKPNIDENFKLSIINAIQINTYFPYVLNKTVGKKTKILQIATDCVYDGVKGSYKETDVHNALDVYGKTKSLGEVNARNFYNVRCSIIGKEIKNFNSLLCWFLRQKKNSKIKGFKNHMWNGITTRQFAKTVGVIIKNNIKIPNLLHIVPKKPINKFQLLKLFQMKFKRYDLKIIKSNAKTVIDRTLLTKNKRINKKINHHMGYQTPPSIEKMINEII